MSARLPAKIPTTNTGKVDAVCTDAISSGDPPKSPMSHTAPTLCIHVPMFDTN
jgi:hypothetical protein